MILADTSTRIEIQESARENIMKSETLQEAALDLPTNERADLARKLLLSLDDPSEEELAQTWLLEAEQRAGEIDRGEVEAVSAEEVRRKARALLR